MKDCDSTDAKPEYVPDMVHSSKQGGFKKKGGNNNIPSDVVNCFKGLGFHIGKDGSKIYKKTSNKLALYTNKKFKNESDFVVCL